MTIYVSEKALDGAVMVHPLADNQSVCIGENTRIWQYTVIMKGAIIGKNCNICAHALVEADVILGDNVTVKSGVYLWDGTRIGNDVFIGPNATFTNDRYPRSKKYPDIFSGISIEEGASIGANATLLPGVVIGRYAMVGAGAVVTKNVLPYSVVAGNPAKIIRRIQK